MFVYTTSVTFLSFGNANLTPYLQTCKMVETNNLNMTDKLVIIDFIHIYL